MKKIIENIQNAKQKLRTKELLAEIESIKSE